MKPLIYGYMRVPEGADDDVIHKLELGLKQLAAVEGFCFATTFYETHGGYRGAFYELTEELQRAEARHVVVPSLEHFSRHPILRDQMIERLEHEANARVWVVEQ